MLVNERLQGKSFDAQAKPFAKFELSLGKDQILSLQYVFDAKVESLGGIAYQCGYNSQRWELQFFRTPYLQRESYRLLCEDRLVVTTDILRILRTTDVTFSDGILWHCHTGMIETVVTDSEGFRMLHTTPRPGLIQSGSSISVDGDTKHERILAMLIILLHSTTHSSR